MTRRTSNEDFREIRLSGKQLVFLFIATTLVSVVIFLCGVLVGRGVRAQSATRSAFTANQNPSNERAGASREVAESSLSTVDETSGEMLDVEISEFKISGAADDEQISSDKQETGLTYHERLESKEGIIGDSFGVSPSVLAEMEQFSNDASTLLPAVSIAVARSSDEAAGEFSPEESSRGYAVQVAALRDRTQAEAIVERLFRRGYPAYVLGPTPGSPAKIYRVRIGSYLDRQRAQEVVHRLETEEKLKPWITR
jgi:septal ring-binding cell division protein DamX